jgi:hypothetical protein
VLQEIDREHCEIDSNRIERLLVKCLNLADSVTREMNCLSIVKAHEDVHKDDDDETAAIVAENNNQSGESTSPNNNTTRDQLNTIDNLPTDTYTTPPKTRSKLMSDSIIELANTQDATERNLKFESNKAANDPQVFHMTLEKLRESIQCVTKHLDSVQRPNRDFSDFEKQIVKMNAIKDALDSIANALKVSLAHKKSYSLCNNKELNKKNSKLLNVLAKDHQLLVKKFKEKYGVYVKNLDIWMEFNKDYQLIDEWLDRTLNSIANISTSSLDECIIRDLFNLTSYRLQLERTNLNGHLIGSKTNDTDSSKINTNLNNLNQKWKLLIDLLSDLKDKYKNKQAHTTSQSRHDETVPNNEVPCDSNQQDTKQDYDKFIALLNETNASLANCTTNLLSQSVSPVDELDNERLLFELRV